jgi:flavin reductase (DIM6/NTAB) family NADH-FMN oxidoreductase RutF
MLNSISGIKSGNLIGTISKEGKTNLAVFNSVIHLGSNPPLFGFTLRPTTVERHTYDNILSEKYFTINHIHKDIISQAHQTAAKYDRNTSEFEAVGLTEEYLSDIKAPFVKESKIKIACKYANEYFIVENQCRLIIGEITHISFDEDIQEEDGFLDLTKAETVGVLGVDAYVKPEMLDRFEYAKPDQDVKSKYGTSQS